MSWLVSAKQYIPAVIGEPFGGGYFAGYISHTANGVPTHALIVAPRATGATGTGYDAPNTTNLAFALNQPAADGINYSTNSVGSMSLFDGVANMTLLSAKGLANFPAAEFCKNLVIGGYSDWYLPSRYELAIAYFNLKPTTGANIVVSASNLNVYAVPPVNTLFTTTYPAQTALSLFGGGAERFADNYHHTSTAESTHYYPIDFSNGFQGGATGNASFNLKTNTYRTRAFRRIAL